MNVGAYCTQGGHQCGQYHNNLVCAIDVDPRGGNFCIKIGCGSSTDCGEGACCYGNLLKACLPSQCVLTDAGMCP
jgi:hypothetical protein